VATPFVSFLSMHCCGRGAGKAGPAQNREHRPRGAAGAQTPGDEGEGLGGFAGRHLLNPPIRNRFHGAGRCTQVATVNITASGWLEASTYLNQTKGEKPERL